MGSGKQRRWNFDLEEFSTSSQNFLLMARLLKLKTRALPGERGSKGLGSVRVVVLVGEALGLISSMRGDFFERGNILKAEEDFGEFRPSRGSVTKYRGGLEGVLERVREMIGLEL